MTKQKIRCLFGHHNYIEDWMDTGSHGNKYNRWRLVVCNGCRKKAIWVKRHPGYNINNGNPYMQVNILKETQYYFIITKATYLSSIQRADKRQTRQTIGKPYTLYGAELRYFIQQLEKGGEDAVKS